MSTAFRARQSRQNRAEAEAVVNELIRRSRDKELSKLSVGVVTFNISQQNLIDDLLAEAFTKRMRSEQWAFETKSRSSKNLENVQEMNAMSSCSPSAMGRDESGRVTMHFGPLNREGGWRRLNVAVSRAREEMIVFSSLTPDQINVSRTSAKGVAALKAFLEYAASGTLVQDENTSRRRCRIQQSGIAESICRALKEHGYDTQQNVGRSEYRIDVGVVDPANPQQYMLGSLLDGPVYGEAKATRDRELNRIRFRRFGWKIHRVWSLDWWDNCDKEIKQSLQSLRIQDRVKQETAKDETENSVEPVHVIHRTVAGIVKL